MINELVVAVVSVMPSIKQYGYPKGTTLHKETVHVLQFDTILTLVVISPVLGLATSSIVLAPIF